MRRALLTACGVVGALDAGTAPDLTDGVLLPLRQRGGYITIDTDLRVRQTHHAAVGRLRKVPVGNVRAPAFLNPDDALAANLSHPIYGADAS